MASISQAYMYTGADSVTVVHPMLEQFQGLTFKPSSDLIFILVCMQPARLGPGLSQIVCW